MARVNAQDGRPQVTKAGDDMGSAWQATIGSTQTHG